MRMASRGRGGTLRFGALASAAEPGFWAAVARRKLERAGLSAAPWPARASTAPARAVGLPALLSLRGGALEAPEGAASVAPEGEAEACGQVLCVNTLEDFKALDRKALLLSEAERIWADIRSGAAEADPQLLTRFLLVCYADLKRYAFYYWLAVPALQPRVPFHTSGVRPLDVALGAGAAAAVCRACESSPPFGLVRLAEGKAEALPLCARTGLGREDWAGASLAVGRESATDGVYVAMRDPSGSPEHPGWPLRNFLLLASTWGLKSVRVLCIRQVAGRNAASGSLALEACLPYAPTGVECPSPVGWELNARGKTGPRFVDLGSTLDPLQRARAAVDLNLKLMRWRALPGLDLDKFASQKCLLLGAGTLGCAVARGLMAWGVRRMTLVDSGNVAYSNPVRQSLFEYEDCLDGGKPKAQAAAEALGRIFPDVEAVGLKLAIPMPGHAVGSLERERVLEDAATLERLVQEHTAVFLLTDTRESRWFPTMLCSKYNKIAINAALGFDSYLVLRHGVDLGDGGGDGGGERLGCYFCNDVVAPLDSTSNRAMDQQCTVVRPGLAPVAGALAVELLVALLQHPEGAAAPGDDEGEAHSGSLLGSVPHSVRGFLGQFSQKVFRCPAFPQCTACSASVSAAYEAGGSEFLLKVFNEPSVLEELTGLSALQQAAANATLDWDEDEGEGEGEGAEGRSSAEGDAEDDEWTEL